MAPKAAKGKAEDTPPPPPATGSGKFYFKSGAVYDGEWMKVPMPKLEGTDTKPVDPKAPPVEQPEATQIMRHGRGEYSDGQYKYTGEWQNDRMHGAGKFVYASGNVYDGAWENGVYQGNGSYVWPDGRRYEGMWQQNRMHGQGMYTDTEGHQWSGQFANGSGPGLTCML